MILTSTMCVPPLSTSPPFPPLPPFPLFPLSTSPPFPPSFPSSSFPSSQKMVAMYDYVPQKDSPNPNPDLELSFKAGDRITIYGNMVPTHTRTITTIKFIDGPLVLITAGWRRVLQWRAWRTVWPCPIQLSGGGGRRSEKENTLPSHSSVFSFPFHLSSYLSHTSHTSFFSQSSLSFCSSQTTGHWHRRC